MGQERKMPIESYIFLPVTDRDRGIANEHNEKRLQIRIEAGDLA